MNKINIMKLIIDEHPDNYMEYFESIEVITEYEGSNIEGYYYSNGQIIVFCKHLYMRWIYVLNYFVSNELLSCTVPFFNYYVVTENVQMNNKDYRFIKIVKRVDLHVEEVKKKCLYL